MKRKFIIILLAGFLFIEGKAQQDPGYTQYMFNTLAINPAYAGSRGMISMLLLSRHQWVGFEGAPSTQTLSIHAPIKHFNSGLGFSIINDNIGPVHQTSVHFDYAFIIKMGETNRLSMGLKSGFKVYQSKLNQLSLDRDGDQLFAEDVRGKFLPNFGMGFYYYSDKFYLGLSTPELLKNELGESSQSQTKTLGREERHYFFTGGFVHDLSQDIKLKPSVLVRWLNGAPVTFDVTLNVILKEQIWAGVMHRFGDSFGILLQYQFHNNFRVGYAFDLSTTEMGRYNNGTHEIMLGYDFMLSKNKIISPRYF